MTSNLSFFPYHNLETNTSSCNLKAKRIETIRNSLISILVDFVLSLGVFIVIALADVIGIM